MKNIHVLPTIGASRLKSLSFYRRNYALSKEPLHWRHACYIYITSEDADIVENDYIITKEGKLVEVSYLLSKDVSGGSKIVLTNDPKLIANGVQEVDEEFLEWFIENPTAEKVHVYSISMTDGVKSFHYKYECYLPETPEVVHIPVKDLNYWKNNCEEEYMHTPISVLRYITELEKALNIE